MKQNVPRGCAAHGEEYIAAQSARARKCAGHAFLLKTLDCYQM